MRRLTPSELLSLWEYGAPMAPARWSLELLALALPDTPLDALAWLSVGQRDAYLLAFHEHSFGSRLACITACPSCPERIELDLEIGEIVVLGSEAVELMHELHLGTYEVHFRVPNSLDLVLIDECAGVESARKVLLDRCVLDARCDGELCPTTALPPPVVAAVAEQMDRADPLAMVKYGLVCPRCGREWEIVFDIVPFLQAQIDAAARRLLQDVHDVARTYGWSEADILAMSPRRRGMYLEMIGL